MTYTTLDYLRDSYWFIDTLLTFGHKAKGALKKFFTKVIEFEYDEYVFRIAENLPYAVVIIFLGLFAILTLAKYSEAKNGIQVGTITTNSMYPAITPGSIIISSQSYNYSKGDIVTYKEVNPKTSVETGRKVTHRIISVQKLDNEEVFVTQGDSNKQPDPVEIKNYQILGEVFMIIPYIGYFYLIVKTLPGFVIFILAPSLLLIKNEVAYIRSLRKSQSKNRDLVSL